MQFGKTVEVISFDTVYEQKIPRRKYLKKDVQLFFMLDFCPNFHVP